METLLLNGKKYSHFEISVWSGVHSPIHMTDGLNVVTVQPNPSQRIGNVSIFFDEDKSNLWAEYVFNPEDMDRVAEGEIAINQAVLSCLPENINEYTTG